MKICMCCNANTNAGGWHLNGYYGITGSLCSSCYNKVARDPYGDLRDPEGYTYMLLKYREKLVASDR